MIAYLLCRLFGHKVRIVHYGNWQNYERACVRCGEQF
jgi:hypothetical protein